MKLDGIHHVTAITADAPGNVDFYARVLGLRLVKKSVNQDDPTVYHLFYGDEDGTPGADITFFEYPGAREGRAGAGMIHTVVWRVGSEEALEFWRERVGSVPFTDPDGLRHGRVGVDGGRAQGRAGARHAGGRASDTGDRPLLVPLDLLPRADGRAVRDRDAGAGLRGGRGSGAPRGDAHPPAELRAPARRSRA